MRCIKTIFSIILAAVMLAACSDDWGLSPSAVPEGEPTRLSIDFGVLAPKERTSRAAQETQVEYHVHNIYVMVFDSHGTRVDDKDCFFSETENNIANKHDKQNDADATTSTGTVTLNAVTGSNMRIVGIANVGTSSAKLKREDLDAVNSLDELQRLSTGINDYEKGNVFRGASFLMTGYAETADGSRDFTITHGEKVNATIQLERVDSKVTFNVSAKATDESGYKNMKFTPKTWQVFRVPQNALVLENPTHEIVDVKEQSRDVNDGQHFESLDYPFEEKSDNAGAFTFYMYENLQQPKQLISEAAEPSDLAERVDKNWQYAYRELENKDDQGKNVDYKYAPDNATYVVMKGELSYQDEKNNYVLADVQYTVHLGYAKEAGSVADDYRTERNSHYTYNITITGVNSLIAEVEQNREERPGAEGDVVISGAQVKDFDAHYGRTKFTFTGSQIGDLIFAIKTPFENGIQTTGTEMHDYKWVKFLINSEVGVSDDVMAEYPGEQCYDGGVSEFGTAAKCTYYNKEVTLRDAKQLAAYLNKNEKGQNVTVTAFIDEFLYIYNPMNDTYMAPNASDPDLTLWKKSIGQGSRMLHLVQGGGSTYSKDGETSVSRSVVSFVQRPIETIYNVNAEGLNSAWGTEMVNETGVLDCSDMGTLYSTTSYPTTCQSKDDGLTNTRKYAAYQSSLKWTDIIDNQNENCLNTGFKTPLYAWALRNRDFDGDGMVDADEVVWYIASINEMQDLWIGENALSEPLFDEKQALPNTDNDSKRMFPILHYMTSTIVAPPTNDDSRKGYSPLLYWAQEYGATSRTDESNTWNTQKSMSYKCLRHLGKRNDEAELPQKYYTIEGGVPNIDSDSYRQATTTNEYVFDLKYLNPVALRQSHDNGNALPYVDLGVKGENNKPYRRFSVAPSASIEESKEWYLIYKSGTSSLTGYRVPNQREMLLMGNYLDGWSKNGYYGMRNAQRVNYTKDNQSGYFIGTFGLQFPLRFNRTSGGTDYMGISQIYNIRPVKDL